MLSTPTLPTALKPGAWAEYDTPLPHGATLPPGAGKLYLFGVRPETALSYLSLRQQADASYRADAKRQQGWRGRFRKRGAAPQPSAGTRALYAALHAFACGALCEHGYPSHQPIGYEDEAHAFIVAAPLERAVAPSRKAA